MKTLTTISTSSMKRLTLLITFILVNLLAYRATGQNRVVDVGKEDVSPLSGLFMVLGGQPISMAKYIKVVEGTPYFSDEWMRGTLIMEGGKKYDSISLKIDLLADEVHYLDAKGNEYIADNRIREIWLTETATRKKYHFVHSSFIGSGTAAAAGWHQLLAEGPAMLFKKSKKEIIETKPYGSATTEQSITTASKYFILKDNTFTPVKSLSVIAELLIDKKSELESYISTNRLKGKTDGDFIGLVSYYNSLQPK